MAEQGEKVACPICGKQYHPQGLGVHMARAHGNRGGGRSKRKLRQRKPGEAPTPAAEPNQPAPVEYPTAAVPPSAIEHQARLARTIAFLLDADEATLDAIDAVLVATRREAR